jgi:hypothetical protein
VSRQGLRFHQRQAADRTMVWDSVKSVLPVCTPFLLKDTTRQPTRVHSPAAVCIIHTYTQHTRPYYTHKCTHAPHIHTCIHPTRLHTQMHKHTRTLTTHTYTFTHTPHECTTRPHTRLQRVLLRPCCWLCMAALCHWFLCLCPEVCGEQLAPFTALSISV